MHICTRPPARRMQTRAHRRLANTRLVQPGMHPEIDFRGMYRRRRTLAALQSALGAEFTRRLLIHPCHDKIINIINSCN